jgi:hypothetical protein
MQEWEYRQYLYSGLGNLDADTQVFSNYSRLVDLLSFDKLFNLPKVQDLWLL